MEMESDFDYGEIVKICLNTFFLGAAAGGTVGALLMGHIIASKMPDAERNQTNSSQETQIECQIKAPFPS